MTQDLANHPHFTATRDAESGIRSHVLTEHVAPVQRAQYFVRPTVGRQSGFLWFYGIYPPSIDTRVTAAVSLDAGNPRTRVFHGFQGAEGNPLVSEDGEGAWVPVRDGIYWVPFDGEPREVWRMPKDFLAGRRLFQLVTDLNLSCDGHWFLLDSWIGNRWLISLVSRDGSEFRPLRWFPRCHHHAIFSSTNPELFLVSHGHWLDPYTGLKNEMDIRIWLMDTQLTRYEPVERNRWFGRNSQLCHEWWSPDGKIQICDYNSGIVEVDPETMTREVIWPRPCTHGQVSPCGRYLVCDVNPYQWSESHPCSVWLFDRETGREAPIVSRMPPQPLPWSDVRTYHIDPHPHFSAAGDLIIYTTVFEGRVTVALTPVADAIAQLEGAGRA